MTSRGIVYIAYGEKALAQGALALSDSRVNHGYPVHFIGEESPIPNISWSVYNRAGRSYWQAARAAKVALYNLTPFDQTLYVDADTRIMGDISAGFKLLDAGYELVIVPSQHQGAELLWHVDEGEREQTLNECGYRPLQLQGGVFFFRKNARTRRLFQLWAEEWQRWQGQDQAALTRALHRTPVRVWLLGRPWNGGAVISHIFGACR